MKSRASLSIPAVFMTIVLCCPAKELVENGDFRKDLPYWRVHQHHGYTPAAGVELRRGVVTFSGLTKISLHYLTLSTMLNIEKGVRYKLSYEIKGPAEIGYRVTVGDQGHRPSEIPPSLHYAASDLPVSNEWRTVEVEFDGKHDTGRKWYKETCKLNEKNRLRNGRALSKPNVIEVEPSDLPCRSILRFSLGNLKGEFSIRNVSVTEVKPAAPTSRLQKLRKR